MHKSLLLLMCCVSASANVQTGAKPGLQHDKKPEQKRIEQKQEEQKIATATTATTETSQAIEQERSEHFHKIVHTFFKINPKMRSIISYMRAVQAEHRGKFLSDIINHANITIDKVIKEKKPGDKEPQWSNPVLNVDLKIGANTFFDYLEADSKIEEAYCSTSTPSLVDAEKLTCEYLETVININMKRGLLKVTEAYISARRNDVKEADVRAKYGDISIEEKAEFQSNAADAEHSYIKLKNDLEMLERMFRLYHPKHTIVEGHLMIPDVALEDLENMIDFGDTFSQFKPLTIMKAKCALDKARNNALSQTTGLFFLRLGGNWSIVPFAADKDPTTDQAKITLSFGAELPIARFFYIYRAAAAYESAKYDYIWEEQKYEIDYAKTLSEVQIAKSAFEGARLAMTAKKLTLDSMVSQYRSGGLAHSKIGQARSDYYHALERYYGSAEKYVKAMLEYLKLTGKIRKIFMQDMENELGGEK